MQKQVFSSFGLKSRNGILVTWQCYAELYIEQFNCFSKQMWSFSLFITNIKHLIFSTHSPTHNIHFYYCHLINMKWCLTVTLIFISLISNVKHSFPIYIGHLSADFYNYYNFKCSWIKDFSMLWNTLTMPAFGKLRQDALEFMARLCYTDKLCLKHKNK